MLFGWLLIAGVAVIGLGLANVALVSEGQLGSSYERRDARVGRRSWPEITFVVGLQEYRLQQWVPLPWWSEGQEVWVWVDKETGRLVPEFGWLHPLLLLLYGFVLAMGMALGLALLPSELASYQARPVEWPVVLQADRGQASTGTMVSLGLIGWVVYDWWDTRHFDWAADLTRLLMGSLMGIAAVHWWSGKVTVTPEEIREESWVRRQTVALKAVASAVRELQRDRSAKKALVSSSLVLRDKEGKELYTFSNLLTPVERMWDLEAYLKERYRDGSPK